MVFLGEKLKHLRETKGYSLRDIERLTGLQPGHVSEIENGITSPRQSTINKICKGLNIDEQYFYMEESRLPIDMLPDMSPELQKFIANSRNTPYLVLSQQAAETGVSPEVLRKIIEALEPTKR